MRMAMRRRTLLLAAAVALLCGGGLAAAVLRPVPSPPPSPQPPLALPVLAANYRAADRIELVRGPATLWLERRGQAWVLAQGGGYPVRPEMAAALVDGLLSLRLDHPLARPPAASADDTRVRILAVSGTVLGALVLSPDGTVLRRPGLPDAWQVHPPLPVSAEVADWIDRHLPMPDLTRATPGSGGSAATLGQALAALRITAVRSALQIHPVPVRSILLGLPDGSANLELGRLDGQAWLHVAGNSAWARSLAPYAFAVPDGSLPP